MSVRALVVGLGSIGQRHARNLRSLLGAELALSAVHTGRASRVVGDNLVSDAGDPAADCDGGVFTDLDTAFQEHFDVVVIANPTSLHLDVALRAVRDGAAVFLEKPVSHSLDGVDALVREARERGSAVAVGCQLRFHPALLALHDLVASGSLGPLVAVHAEQAQYLPSYHPYEDYRSSYAARSELGGGVVLTQIHELDYLQWLFGRPSSVYAVGGQVSSLEIDVEDVASALLAHHYGGRPLPVHLHLDYLQRVPRRTVRVVGEEGSATVDLLTPELVVTDGTGAIARRDEFPGFERAQLFVEELRDFVSAWRDRRDPAVDLEFAVDTLRTAVALKRSLRSGALEQVGAETG